MEKLLARFEMKSLTDEGRMAGYASVKGNVDRHGEVIAPGAYKNLEDFNRDGSAMFCHSWDRFPIGTIDMVKEDQTGLYFEATFHSTPTAQECRTLVKERLERNKTVGVSIGYSVMSDAMELRDGVQVRVLKEIELYELSVVPVPANPLALLASAKSVNGLGENLLAGYSLQTHSDAVLGAVEDWSARLKGLQEARAEKGQALTRYLGSITDCAKRLSAAVDFLKSLEDGITRLQPANMAEVEQARLALLDLTAPV